MKSGCFTLVREGAGSLIVWERVPRNYFFTLTTVLLWSPICISTETKPPTCDIILSKIVTATPAAIFTG